MGVHQLWQLLAPVGRKRNIEALSQKRLAVDASIWLIQFIKAMRDDRSGEMLQNAPLLGLFRRLVKLLYLHIRPVLVFDGATPALKRHTVARRRQFRQSQESSLRRTAEKILLNQLKGRDLLHGLPGQRARRSDPPATSQFDSQFAADDDAIAAAQRGGGGGGGSAEAGGGSSEAAIVVHDSSDEGDEFEEAQDAPADDAWLGEDTFVRDQYVTMDEVLARAADKVRAGGAPLSSSASLAHLSREALGSIVVPRACDLDSDTVRGLPPALQFEVLDEIKLAEKSRRRDQLVRTEHTIESFSQQQVAVGPAHCTAALRTRRPFPRSTGAPRHAPPPPTRRCTTTLRFPRSRPE